MTSFPERQLRLATVLQAGWRYAGSGSLEVTNPNEPRRCRNNGAGPNRAGVVQWPPRATGGAAGAEPVADGGDPRNLPVLGQDARARVSVAARQAPWRTPGIPGNRHRAAHRLSHCPGDPRPADKRVFTASSPDPGRRSLQRSGLASAVLPRALVSLSGGCPSSAALPADPHGVARRTLRARRFFVQICFDLVAVRLCDAGDPRSGLPVVARGYNALFRESCPIRFHRFFLRRARPPAVPAVVGGDRAHACGDPSLRGHQWRRFRGGRRFLERLSR